MSQPLQYQQRLNDGRNVWLHGEIITDIATHPDFRGTINTIDSLLQLQTKQATKASLMYQTDEGKSAHLSYLIPRSKEDLAKKRQAYQLWADETFGVMSRLSEYSRSLITGWYANRSAYASTHPEFVKKIEHYYRQSRDFDLLSTAAGHDPQIDRSKQHRSDNSTILHVAKKTEQGVFVKGAKMIATAAPYVDELLIFSYHRRSEKEKAFANVFVVPTNANGLQIVCRESFAKQDITDHPISSQFDEMDAVLVFDNVFIPWERVLVYEDPDLAWKLRTDRASALLSQHQTVVRLVSKLESLVAIGDELAETAGVTTFLHVKEKLAELIIQLESIKALLYASEQKAAFHNGVLLPDQDSLATARNLGTRFYPRALEIIQQVGAGGLLQSPSQTAELNGPIGSLLKKYYKGTHTSAKERTALMKLTWDLVGSSLASRHELYERFYSGDPVRTYAVQYNTYQRKQQLIDFANLALNKGEK
ncbi:MULTISPECIES: 4-hydroxyphenylacetate 3-hydroxylase family protein [Shouchella]|uniref:4-hydroxyphenylacetate 3-hydroxylase family protein n=1 Tax=Shouchella TaxID=2893057 RepID=UPI000920EE63|nr:MULTISPECIES: 4-hydroxyphenylacetate 3-hydroxylase N-terminal domain-containing protein [Shouchella]MCM3311395.1 4-hydroxyphenylacetate 3-hydroxylase [Psychrobacillus sp. MER TA 17]MDO7285063.1 4-hydroxyphenylacetate 3-hydroxylase N-terminal domain-containing protein [Shouchella clausii]MDO7305069.1 4-hydroxyphenylacetate 3-hydroxylase N-terminal domain-containing protein [Shouchella clausii]PAF10110.1 4-hydroxyphenylacetate 3-hydroxylase [Shouchella clausii]SHL25010.1 4-hydroxyphenylacetat